MELEFLNLGKLDERYGIFTYIKTHKIHHSCRAKMPEDWLLPKSEFSGHFGRGIPKNFHHFTSDQPAGLQVAMKFAENY